MKEMVINQAQLPDLSEASSREKAAELCRILDKKLAQDLVWIDVSDSSELTDYYIVATGRSGTHVLALVGELEFEAGRRGIQLLHPEHKDGSTWLLLDFGDVIVHIFSREGREFYRYERLFDEAQRLDVSAVLDEGDGN
jgi:ribosome-associated protein